MPELLQEASVMTARHEITDEVPNNIFFLIAHYFLSTGTGIGEPLC
jgi:hypothetical protein